MTEDSQPDAELLEAFSLAAIADQGARQIETARKRKPKSRLEVISSESELSKATLNLRDRRQTIALKRTLAYFAIAAVSVQLLCANVMFAFYLAIPEWRLNTPPEVVIAWMSATVVEVIGIVVIIARNLFPSNEHGATKRQMSKLLASSKSAE